MNGSSVFSPFFVWLAQVFVLLPLFAFCMGRGLPQELTISLVVALWFGSVFLHMFGGRLVVGHDGFSVSWLGAFRRHVRYQDVTAISRKWHLFQPHSRVLVHRTVGRRYLEIHVYAEAGAVRIETALREALAAWRTPRVVVPLIAPIPVEAATLDRSNRSVEEWVAHLRRIGDGAVHLRVAVPPREVLWKLVENEEVPPQTRAAAAVSLGGAAASDADRARLMTLASGMEDSSLGETLEFAARDDEALGEALEALAEDRESEPKS